MMRYGDEQKQTLEHELGQFFDALSDECKEAKIKSEQKLPADAGMVPLRGTHIDN